MDAEEKSHKKELQSLIGKLSWAACAIKGGRTFLRRLIDVMASLKKKHHHIRLSATARADISWWSKFMDVFNGTVQFICDVPVPSAIFSSDACSKAGGAVYMTDWFYANWELDYPAVSELHINIQELFSVLLAARRWSSAWQNKHLVVYTDSQCTMYMINKGSSKNIVAMGYLRELFWLSATYNFHMTSRHIPGTENSLSDFVSRLHEHSDWYNQVHWCGLDANILRHMSSSSFMYLQTVAHHSGQPCYRNPSSSSGQLTLIPPSQHILPCVMPTLGSAFTLAGHQYQRIDLR